MIANLLSSLRMAFVSPVKHYLKDSMMRVEHVGQVDFRTSMTHLSWRIVAIIPLNREADLSMGMHKHRLHAHYMMGTKELGVKTVGHTFKPWELAGAAEMKDARKKLIKMLNGLKAKLIWKEDLHGYEISESGRIIRKWELGKEKLRVPSMPMSGTTTTIENLLPPETIRSLCKLALANPVIKSFPDSTKLASNAFAPLKEPRPYIIPEKPEPVPFHGGSMFNKPNNLDLYGPTQLN